MPRFLIFAASVACNFAAIKIAEKVVDRYLDKNPYAGLRFQVIIKKAA